MHTGDVAYMDEDGFIRIVDRLKDVLESGGEWMVSQELENLLSLCEGMLEAAVIGIPDEKWGKRPLAILVPREESRGNSQGYAPRPSQPLCGGGANHQLGRAG